MFLNLAMGVLCVLPGQAMKAKRLQKPKGNMRAMAPQKYKSFLDNEDLTAKVFQFAFSQKQAKDILGSEPTLRHFAKLKGFAQGRKPSGYRVYHDQGMHFKYMKGVDKNSQAQNAFTFQFRSMSVKVHTAICDGDVTVPVTTATNKAPIICHYRDDPQNGDYSLLWCDKNDTFELKWKDAYKNHCSYDEETTRKRGGDYIESLLPLE